MLKPLANNLLIKGIENETVTASGIILANKGRERPTIGKVVAIGPGVKSVKEGDKVLIKGYMVDEISIDSVNYLITQEEGVIGIISGEL